VKRGHERTDWYSDKRSETWKRKDSNVKESVYWSKLFWNGNPWVSMFLVPILTGMWYFYFTPSRGAHHIQSHLPHLSCDSADSPNFEVSLGTFYRSWRSPYSWELVLFLGSSHPSLPVPNVVLFVLYFLYHKSFVERNSFIPKHLSGGLWKCISQSHIHRRKHNKNVVTFSFVLFTFFWLMVYSFWEFRFSCHMSLKIYLARTEMLINAPA
jgi:hypothetical protein